ADHAPYAKRAMARDMVSVMEKLGFPRFSVAGHDRGGRVAYRLALDHPGQVERLAVLDILPTADTWERADKRLATAFWPWSLLAQPEPLPERLVSAAPDAVVDDALGGWGAPANAFGSEVRAAYIEALRNPARVHAICEEYRAAATLDHEHDVEDRHAGRRIACPVLVLWSGRGPLGSWYAELGGPLALWRAWATDVRGGPLDAGHFFAEEIPERTAEELSGFFATTPLRKRAAKTAAPVFVVGTASVLGLRFDARAGHDVHVLGIAQEHGAHYQRHQRDADRIPESGIDVAGRRHHRGCE